mmetsp:Transcript_21265/g.46361  ORF Transcript_21265/g.46361 Transcript_21265/m.46361 type:complete len:82 (-) Transcript_21265:103-348(-)
MFGSASAAAFEALPSVAVCGNDPLLGREPGAGGGYRNLKADMDKAEPSVESSGLDPAITSLPSLALADARHNTVASRNTVI